MKRILFVDDETRLLEALKRTLRPLHDECDLRFVTSGLEALQMLDREPFDMLITDIRMPGMDGSELLAAVREQHPEVTRIILSGTTDLDLTVQTAVTAHQYLSKPCDSETLRATIRRALAQRHLVAAPLQRALSQITALPSVPVLYFQLMQEIGSPDASIERLAQIVAQDPAMSAKMMQLVNSAFFGYRRHIETPAEAAVYLGPETMSKLALSASVFSEFTPSSLPNFDIDTFWRHSLSTSALAGRIAAAESATPGVVAEARVAGLLHDIGKLVFALSWPQEYGKVLARLQGELIGEVEAERQAFGADHAEAGGHLLWLWGLPDSIVGAVACHHSPAACSDQPAIALTAVHVANILNAGSAATADDGSCGLDLEYLNGAGLAARIPKWRGMLEPPAAP